MSQRKQRAQRVIDLVKAVRIQMPRIGTRKLYHILQYDLRELGIGRDKLFSILKANHMQIIPKRSYHITTDSHHRFRKHKNSVAELSIVRPEQVWVSDITYIGNRTNPMYLALVTDAYSKKVVGYDVSKSLSTTGSLRALLMATRSRRNNKEKLIHHSDRGLQYCSDDYQKVLITKKIKCSMTESYDPYANAVAERINGILKQEFLGYDRKLPINIMKQLVKDSVRIYNTVRPHYSCHLLTPQKMHNQRKLKMKTYKNKNSQENVLLTV